MIKYPNINGFKTIFSSFFLTSTLFKRISITFVLQANWTCGIQFHENMFSKQLISTMWSLTKKEYWQQPTLHIRKPADWTGRLYDLCNFWMMINPYWVHIQKVKITGVKCCIFVQHAKLCLVIESLFSFWR